MATFGDIPSNLVIGAGESLRRDAGDTAFEAFTPGGGGGSVSDTAYGPSWDGETTTAPSQNALYDKIQTLVSLINIDGGSASLAGSALTAIDGGNA